MFAATPPHLIHHHSLHCSKREWEGAAANPRLAFWVTEGIGISTTLQSFSTPGRPAEPKASQSRGVQAKAAAFRPIRARTSPSSKEEIEDGGGAIDSDMYMPTCSYLLWIAEFSYYAKNCKYMNWVGILATSYRVA